MIDSAYRLKSVTPITPVEPASLRAGWAFIKKEVLFCLYRKTHLFALKKKWRANQGRIKGEPKKNLRLLHRILRGKD
ncbi:MAG: hypothetical protein D3915_06905 [Candidatus Electrothrix sp. AU1_5]|nr:hypothetical protein [Candidatus Electrothrix gigas]